MIIAYLGNFKHSFCTEVHLAKTLEAMGHYVVRIQEDDYTDVPRKIYKQVKNSNAQLFLFTRTWGKSLNMEYLDAIKELGIPTVSYHLDLYYGLSRTNWEIGLDQDPFWRTDYVFTPDGDPEAQKWFEEKGINHFYLKPGVYEPECYIKEPTGIGPDIVFVGSYYYHPEWPYRQRLINWLRETYGSRFAKFGNPESTIRGDQLNKLYSEAKIVIGDALCIGFDHEGYWSDRLYETTGRGGFLIHPYIKGIEKSFEIGKELITYEYDNFKQLKEWIDYYLEHEKEREAIRIAGHNRTKSEHTYTHRLKEMFEVLKDNGIT
jgi:hypothetical protein